MRSKMNKPCIKSVFKSVLIALLTFQLSFMPRYGYSASGSENGDSSHALQSLLNDIKSSSANPINNPGALEKIAELNELATAIEQGKQEEYLRQNPQVRGEIDYFMLSDQRVKVIETHFDSQTNRMAEVVAETIELNDYNSMSFVPNFKELKVVYIEESKTLNLEGVSKERVQLRQIIPDLDVIDYVNDGEFLLILDRRKGLLLIDMFFAKAYLGLAPVPVIRIPLSLFENSTGSWSAFHQEKAGISLELINYGTRPVDSVPDNISKNFKGESLWTAGDFMISYRDPNSDQKHIVRILKREELRELNKLNYSILDIMIKTVAPHLIGIEEKGGEVFQKELEGLKDKGQKAELDYLLSTLFSKNSLHKLGLAQEGMFARVKQMSEPLSDRDNMLLSEWGSAYQKITQRLLLAKEAEIKKKLLQEEEIQRLRKKYQSDPSSLSPEQLTALQKDLSKKYRANPAGFSTEDWAILQSTGILSSDKSQKTAQPVALKIMASLISNKVRGYAGKARDWANFHKITTAGTITLTTGFFVFPETYILISNKFLNLLNHLSYYLSSSSYESGLTPHFIVMGTLPFVILSIAMISIPFLKGLRKVLQKTAPQKARGMIDWLTSAIENWHKEGPMTRTAAGGMKFFANVIYPLWHYLAKIAGQPHFIPAIQKNLKPFQKIDPKSDIGELAGLTKPARLGVGQPQWRQNGSFKRQRQLQNIAQEKISRQNSLAWIMAVLAVAEKAVVSPEQIIIYGFSSLNMEDLKKIGEDSSLRMEMLWVRKHLLKEMQKLDEMDLRKALSEVDPETVLRYYEKANTLAQQAKAHPNFVKRNRAFWNEGKLGALRQKINLSNIVNWNQAEHDMLKKLPTGFIQGRITKNFIMDQALVTVMPPLMTERAQFNMEGLFQPALSHSDFAHSSRQHMFETGENAIGWLLLSPALYSLIWTERTQVIREMFQAHSQKYQPLENHTYLGQEQVQKEGAYYFKQFLYLFSGGKEDNLGGVMFRHLTQGFRALQFGIALALSVRLGYMEQPFEQAVLAWLMMRFISHWMFGWPWDIIDGGDKNNQKELGDNKKKLSALKLKLSKVHRGLYPQAENLIEDYRSALKETILLYGIKQKRLLESRLQSISGWESFFLVKEEGDKPTEKAFSVSRESAQSNAKILLELLMEKPPLPTKVNQTADFTTTFFLGGVVTTYLAVLLFFWSFDPDKLTVEHVSKLIALSLLLYFFFRGLYKKDMKGIRGFFEGLRVFLFEKGWPEKVADIKEWNQKVTDWAKKPKDPKEWSKLLQHIQEWGKQFPKKSKNWGTEIWNRSYSRLLDLSKATHWRCQQAFKKKTK